MSTLSTVDLDTVEADLDFLTDFAEKNRERYLAGLPFPHISIDNLGGPDVIDAVIRDFPGRD